MFSVRMSLIPRTQLFCNECCSLLRTVSRSLSAKHIRNRWIIPYSLKDDFNLENREPDVYDLWYNERSDYVNSKQVEEERNTALYEVLRDISGLPVKLRSRLPHHRKFLESQTHSETSRAYQRACIGLYGLETTKLDPSVCWPSTQELSKLQALYNQVEGEDDVKTRVENEANEKLEAEIARRDREAKIQQNLDKMPQEIAKYELRLRKEKEAEASKATAQKLLLEEAREYFGFKVDARDDKFKNMKAMKEEEALKKKKAAKKEANKLKLGVRT